MPNRGGSTSGRGRKGKGSLPREVEISKALSLTLRHRAVSDGLKIDKNGYVNLAELVSWFYISLDTAFVCMKRRMFSFDATVADL